MGADLIQQPLTLWKFGIEERVDRGTPLVLNAATLAAALGVRFSTPRLAGAAAGYQVTAGRTLVLTRVVFRADTALIGFSVGYSDSDRGLSNVADGANPVDLDGGAATGLSALVPLTANVMYDVAIYFEIVAAKFPRVVTPLIAGNLYTQFFGVEV